MNPNQEHKKRSLSFGVNSAFITLVVIALVGLLNFLGKQYPKRLDLTKNKIHTFSDQTTKVVQGLKEPVKATLYGDFGSRERHRPVFENYKKASPLFEYETVDPNKEPTRAKAAGIKKMDTLILTYKGRTARVEDISEEKITNELIKLTKDTQLVVCAILGHGESSFTDSGATGFSTLKKGLEDQFYQVKEITLPQETRIPPECSTLVMMGSSKALFPVELKMLSEYLDNGGRMVVGVDAQVSGQDNTGDLRALISQYGITLKSALIVDPISKMLGVDATVPMMPTFNRDTAIGKDAQGQCFFPFSRPVEVAATAPEGLKTAWLTKSTPQAFGETDLAGLSKGRAQKDSNDLAGPLTSSAVVSGKKKDSKANRETRIAVFGSGQFANNQFSRFGGNLDLFLNAVSWALEDESLISIRSKEEDAAKIELTQTQGTVILWICIILAPLTIAILGVVIWVRRKKL